jgi:hypothetical protein
MRHGRKSQAQPFMGYTRHVLNLLDSKLVVEAVCQPANQPEHAALETLWPAFAAYGQVRSLPIDRAYLSSPLLGALKAQGVESIAKPWPLHNRGRFPTAQCQSNLDAHEVTCPAGVTMKLKASGRQVQCSAETCGRCVLQAGCPTSARGRTRSMHAQERLLLELRAARHTAEGRQALRQQTGVEHTLACLDQIQGKRARDKGTRKNTLELRWTAAVNNLQQIHRALALEQAA